MSKSKSSHSPRSELGQASPFAILLAALLGVLVLAVLCTGAVFILREDPDQAGVSATSTAIAVANATTLAQNARVTQTISAMETEAAQPTNTPTATAVPPTETATVTPTSPPTETPVIEEPEATPTPNLFGTSIFGGEATPTPITGGTGGTDTGGTLPDTGFNVTTLIVAAIGLLLLVIAARRLRTG